jgi:hypothetical protein
MYPVGSILRHYPSTPLPSAAEAEVQLKAMPPPKQWYREDRSTREQRQLLTRQMHCKHYSAVVLANGILQVKPKKQMFSSVEEWCASMHEPPAALDKLLDHFKAIAELERKKRSASSTIHMQQYKITIAEQRIRATQSYIACLEDKIEHHRHYL